MIPLLDKTIIKLGIISALIIALIGFAKWSYDSIYEAGVNSQIAKQKEANDKTNKEYTKKISEALENNKKEKEQSAKLLEELNNVEHKFREIQKATANSDCKSFGVESFELFNSFIGTEPAY